MSESVRFGFIAVSCFPIGQMQSWLLVVLFTRNQWAVWIVVAPQGEAQGATEEEDASNQDKAHREATVALARGLEFWEDLVEGHGVPLALAMATLAISRQADSACCCPTLYSSILPGIGVMVVISSNAASKSGAAAIR